MTESALTQNLHDYLSTLPPQNIEAEEWILGGIILDPEAMSRVVDLLTPEAFYFSDHQEIYRAALALYSEDKPTDFMSVTSWLYDHKSLDKVGGQSKIAQLIERTVSAVNIDRHAALVMDKFLRRRLIESGNEITKIGYDLLYTQEECLDRARQKIESVFSIPLKRQDKLKIKHKKLIAEIERVELEEEDPSFKYLKFKEIAKRFRLSVKEIDEIWLKYLIYSEGSGELKSFSQLLEQSADYTKWLIQGILREVGLTVLHAPGGGLKTTIAYDWLYSLLKGIPWEGFPTTSKKRRVLIIQTDENVSDTIPSLIARGYDETLDVSFVDRWNIQNGAAFNRYLTEFEPDIVLIDSLFSVSSGSLYSENDAEYARPILWINKIAQERGKQVILIHHSNAEGGLRGTGAIKASATAVMSLAADPDHPGPDSPWRILTIEKFRGRCLTRYSLEFFAEDRRFICHGEYKKQDESSSLKDRIIKFLATHRNTRYEIDELMEFCGGAKASVRRAASQLSSAGIISSCRQSPHSKKMVYFLEWEGEDEGGGDWGGDDIDPDPSDPSPDNHFLEWKGRDEGGNDIDLDPSDPSPRSRIGSGSLDDHLNGSLVESSLPEGYSGSTTAKDPVITENQLFSCEVDTEEKPEGMIAREREKAEIQAQQEEQSPNTSDPSSDHQVITPRSATDQSSDVITNDQLANCRGLSIQQPFATLVARGEKRFETRGQKTNYRGLILIHSPKKIDKHSFNRICREQDDPALFPTRRVLAVAELTDCIFMDESFINEQPDQELLHGLWEPGRYAWKLENIRPLKQQVTGVGALGLWKPNDLLMDRLVNVELCDRVDQADDRWSGVAECVEQITRHPELRDEVLGLYPLSDRQRDEVARRLKTISDEAPGADDDSAVTIFDQIQVGDRVCRTGRNGGMGTVGIVTKKSFSPRQVEIIFPQSKGLSKTRVATPEELELLRIQIVTRLRAGLRIKLGVWYGTLSSQCKNGKWYINWEGFPDKGIRKKYGEPPNKAIAPQDLEVIDES